MGTVVAKTKFFMKKKLYLLMIQIIHKSVLGFYNQNVHNYEHKLLSCDKSQRLKRWVKNEKNRIKLKLNIICELANTTLKSLKTKMKICKQN